MRRRSFVAALASVSLVPQTMGAGMPHFKDLVAASLPKGIALPRAFEQAIDWLEVAGYVVEDRYAALTPPDGSRSIALQFEPVSEGHAAAWLRTDDPAFTQRLAPIIRTGGDGSYAALWRADDGPLSIVHMGSGSGSIMMRTLVESPPRYAAAHGDRLFRALLAGEFCHHSSGGACSTCRSNWRRKRSGLSRPK